MVEGDIALAEAVKPNRVVEEHFCFRSILRYGKLTVPRKIEGQPINLNVETSTAIGGGCPGLRASQAQVDVALPNRILFAQSGEWRLLFFIRLAIELLIAGSQATDGAGFQLFASGSRKQIPITTQAYSVPGGCYGAD